jgi:hypothetical protein
LDSAIFLSLNYPATDLFSIATVSGAQRKQRRYKVRNKKNRLFFLQGEEPVSGLLFFMAYQ